MTTKQINSDTIRRKIQEAYYRDQRVASDDTLLLCRIWERSGWDNTKSLLQNLRAVPSPETVRRTRQKMVVDGTIQPCEKVLQERKSLFSRIREKLGYRR